MKCRGKELREKLIEMYDIKPVAHVKLLEGQVKKSCTGDELTDNYYCFSYQIKGKSNSTLKSFYCGSHASKHFLELLELEPLVCFNPLKGVNRNSGGSRQGSKENYNSNWNETMKELYNALNLLVVYWDVAPRGAILDIKLKIEKYKYANPYDGIIKSVNTIVSKDKNGYKMKDIMNFLKETNDIKDYSFDRVNERLRKMEIESYF